jgi:PPK2 family polyphosphate:nucleotide phosphotransferase
MSQPTSAPPGTKIRLRDFDAHDDSGLEKAAALLETNEHVCALAELTYRLYAENRRALLIVLQGMDTSGKDGTIRHVMHGVNPQTCQVVSFKQPSSEELDHDFLWRIHKEAPRRGNIGIFNRSHYEDVLVVRVHNLVPKEVWRARYEQINEFEKILANNDTKIVKIFLHISKEEQKQRLEARLKDPTKSWKFNKADLDERKLWDEYQAAYEDALTRCNTDCAPWHIVPADRKWHRNLLVSRLLRQTLDKMDPQFPPPEPGLDKVVIE